MLTSTFQIMMQFIFLMMMLLIPGRVVLHWYASTLFDIMMQIIDLLFGYRSCFCLAQCLSAPRVSIGTMKTYIAKMQYQNFVPISVIYLHLVQYLNQMQDVNVDYHSCSLASSLPASTGTSTTTVCSASHFFLSLDDLLGLVLPSLPADCCSGCPLTSSTFSRLSSGLHTWGDQRQPRPEHRVLICCCCFSCCAHVYFYTVGSSLQCMCAPVVFSYKYAPSLGSLLVLYTFLHGMLHL